MIMPIELPFKNTCKIDYDPVTEADKIYLEELKQNIFLLRKQLGQLPLPEILRNFEEGA